MASLRSRLFLFALRYRNLFTFQLKRKPMVDKNTSIPKLREKTEKTSALFGKLPKGFELSPLQINGRYAEWVAPQGVERDRGILYFHGGGYVLGSPQGHRAIVSKFVKGTGMCALVFDYRLAPEHPFPGALEDSVAAYRYMLDEGIDPSKIVFSGDSAGGGLCLATLLAIKEEGLPMPAAASVMSPWTDLKCTGDSLTRNLDVDFLTWRESWNVFSDYYVKDGDATNPLISPLYGDLKGLPPLMIHVGGDELLLDDSTRFSEKAKEAGVNVTLKIGEKMFHCYPVCAPLFPEATEAMEEICDFLKSV